MKSPYQSDTIKLDAKFCNKYSVFDVNEFNVYFGKAMNICMINDSYIGFLLNKYVIGVMALGFGSKMELQQFLDAVASTPEQIEFETTIAVIEANYEFTPAAFSNGETQNRAGENNGSCKIFAFGLLNDLDKDATLACFGRFYREDVLQHPENSDHQNIRNFMVSGWSGVKFDSPALEAK